MDQAPRDGAYRDAVPLGGDKQLLKRRFRPTPPNPDQYPHRGVEHAPTLRVGRELGGSPLCCHIVLICFDDRTEERDQGSATTRSSLLRCAPDRHGERAQLILWQSTVGTRPLTGIGTQL